MKSTTNKLVAQLNELRGLRYPEIGYVYFADVRGNGDGHKSLWQIVNEQGGVAYSLLNGRTKFERCANLREAIRKERAGK